MIETAEDYNDRLEQCGCCLIPACPTPTVIYERKTATGFRCSMDMWNEILDTPIPPCADLRGAWGEYVRTVTNNNTGGIQRSTFTRQLSAPDGDCVQTTLHESENGGTSGPFGTRVSRTYSGGTFTETWDYFDPGRYTVTEAYSEFTSEVDTLAAMTANANAKIAAMAWASGGTFSYRNHTLNSYLVATCPPDPVVTAVNLRKLRARFRIPSTHLGSYFKITYDIAEFPDDPGIPPSFVSQDNVLEWSGPGVGASTDPSWLTDWFEIEPPDIWAYRSIVNIRYVCRHGAAFPALPQVMGESFEPPEP